MGTGSMGAEPVGSDRTRPRGRADRERRVPAGTGHPGDRSRSGSQGSGSAGTPPRDPEQHAREICLRLLETRPRTRAELAAALARRGIEDEVAERVLGRYAEVGLVDDEAFARAWVSTRHEGKGLARRALAGELRRKGVDDDLVADAVAAVAPEDERATGRRLVDRRLRATVGQPAPVRVRRLVAVLARKGYPAATAWEIVRDALAAEGEADQDALADLDDLVLASDDGGF